MYSSYRFTGGGEEIAITTPIVDLLYIYNEKKKKKQQLAYIHQLLQLQLDYSQGFYLYYSFAIKPYYFLISLLLNISIHTQML